MTNRNKVHASDSHVPQCLGSIINMLDVNPCISGNNCLIDKPHNNGYSLVRSRSLNSMGGDTLEDKLAVADLRNKSCKRTPIKTFIDHEMSKDVEPKNYTPNLVAKLMGLDAPQSEQIDSSVHYRRPKLDGTLHPEQLLDWHIYSNVSDKQRVLEANYFEQKECKGMKDAQKSRRLIDRYEEKMAIVKQKFVEAKHIVINEKLQKTKEFQDALDFLSSNQDLLLSCLGEPNSPFTQQWFEENDFPETLEAKHIIVLKPSIPDENGKIIVSHKQNVKHAHIPASLRSKSYNGCSSTFLHWDEDDPLSTRMKVSKSIIGNAHVNGTATSPDSSSIKTTKDEDYFIETESSDALESIGDVWRSEESSKNKSHYEYDGESISEVMSPNMKHSWDCINRLNTPFSESSYSGASHYPESSVTLEAKTRLSERWAKAAQDVKSLEKNQISTLGEILALSGTKKNLNSEKGGYTKEATCSTSFVTQASVKDESLMDSPRGLPRSKSLPVSSSLHGLQLNAVLSGPNIRKPDKSALKEKPSSKLSLKEMMSSLFFKTNKKAKNTAPNPSEYECDQPHLASTRDTSAVCTGKCFGNDLTLGDTNNSEDCTDIGLQMHKEDIASSEAVSSVLKPARFNDCEPSPDSVLATLFAEDDNADLENIKQEQGTSLIDRSPQIRSVLRTQNWKDSFSDTASTFSATNSVHPLEPETGENWFLFVRTLLTDTFINEEFESDTFFTRWHLPDSPLNPKLREMYINLPNTVIPCENHRKQWRSSRKLVFDSVNAALADITKYHIPETKQRLQTATSVSHEGYGQVPLSEMVCSRLKEWIMYDTQCILRDDGNIDKRLLKKTVVKNEVLGKAWDENMRGEMEQVGKGIEEKILDELLEDAVFAMTYRGSYQPSI